LHESLERIEGEKVLSIIGQLLRSRDPGRPLTFNFETPAETVHLDAIALVLFIKDILGF